MPLACAIAASDDLAIRNDQPHRCGRAAAELRAEFNRAGKGERFEALSLFLFEEPAPGAYARLAEEWKVTGSGLRSSVQRIRQRYAALFRAEIAGTVQDPREVDSEIAYLLSALND